MTRRLIRLICSAILPILFPLCAESSTNIAPPLAVTLTALAVPLMDVQETKGAFLSIAPKGDSIRVNDMSPVLCLVVISNESAKPLSIHSPVEDVLGYYSVQMEYSEGGRIFRRGRDEADSASVIAGRLDPKCVNFRTLRTLAPGDSLAIPISVAEFWPPELGHIYRASSNTMVRAIYTFRDPKDEKTTTEISSHSVSLKTLLAGRIDAYSLATIPIERSRPGLQIPMVPGTNETPIPK